MQGKEPDQRARLTQDPAQALHCRALGTWDVTSPSSLNFLINETGIEYLKHPAQCFAEQAVSNSGLLELSSLSHI